MSLTNGYSGPDETIMHGSNSYHTLARMILTCDLKMYCVDSHRNYRTLVRPQVYSASFEDEIDKPLLSIRSLRLACALAASYSNRANVWETPSRQGCGRCGSAALPACGGDIQH